MKAVLYPRNVHFGGKSFFINNKDSQQNQSSNTDISLFDRSLNEDLFERSVDKNEENRPFLFFAIAAAGSFLGLLYSGLKASKL